MKKVRVLLGGFLLLCASQAFAVDSFRIGAMRTVTLDPQSNEPLAVELGFNDALGILFPKDATFIRGVEIELKIPQEIIALRNSMAYGLYRLVTPYPSETKIDYQGEQLTLQALPSKLSFVLQIPLQKNHGLKNGPYSTVLSYVHDPAKGPLVFRLLPVMKGLPDNIETIKFTARIKPILTEEGGMQLKLAWPTEEKRPVTVRIDEMLVENPDQMRILPPGDHHLSVVSEDYRNEVRVFTVESARVTSISVTLKDTEPHIVLVAPENALIQLDGKQVTTPRESLPIEPGEHTVLFRIGDYEFSRMITAEKGKDYTVTMIIDVTVTETP